MKRLAIFTVLIFILSIPLSFADPGDTLWTRSYGGGSIEDGTSVDFTDDGGYIICGSTQSFGAGYYDIYLVKTDADGDTLWTRTYGTADYEQGESVKQTSDGGYIIAGCSGAAPALDVYLVKTDSNGNAQWTRTFGGSGEDYGHSVVETTDGGFVVAGYDSYGSGDISAYLIKTDVNGNQLWARNYGGSYDDFAFSVKETSDGGFILAGMTRSYGAGQMDAYLIKTNSGGGQEWYRTYGGSGNDRAYDVSQTADGGYVLTGFIDAYDNGNADVYIVKTTPNGTTEWARAYGGPQYDCGESVMQTSSGGYIVSGYYRSQSTSNDIYLIKTDASGDSIWTRTYGWTSNDYGNCVRIDPDDNYIVAGSGSYDFLLMKVQGEFINTPPVITDLTRVPEFPAPSEACEISAIITDSDGYIVNANLYYDAGSGYTAVAMNNTADSFYATIPGQPAGTDVSYYISAEDDWGDITYSDTLGYYVATQVCMECSMENYSPLVPNEGGRIDWSLTVTNCDDDPVSVHAELYPTIGDCVTGNQITGFDIHGEVVQDLPGNSSYTTYYYYYTPTVQNFSLAGLTLAIGPAHDQYVSECCFEFHFSYPFPLGDNPGMPVWNEPGLWLERGNAILPEITSLGQNYPNPFNAETNITFDIAKSGNVSVKVYNLAGQLMETLVEGYMQAGHHSVNWDASTYSSG
ncbi:MAG: T9SS type A sorting domain-containing protein, partial [candidate division Zixibacteria bacterium]|nr:T9SS type A sorting domain-containing protein [candidate division Zixibacteria bacterium]